jgi:hypothetical protein
VSTPANPLAGEFWFAVGAAGAADRLKQPPRGFRLVDVEQLYPQQWTDQAAICSAFTQAINNPVIGTGV